MYIHIEEGWREKQRQRSSRLFGGQNFVQFLAALAVLPGRFGRNSGIHPILPNRPTQTIFG